MTITWEQILAFLCEDQSMAVTSLLFIAFFVAVALVHYLLPRVLRPYFLLAASYGFFCYDPVNRPLVGVLLGATAVSWLCGLIIGKVKAKPVRVLALLVTVLGGVGILVYYKYWNMLADTFGGSILSHRDNLLAPLGLSYFTFAAMSYTIDVYKRRCKVETNPLHYALFVSFFPTLITGPIERYPQMRPQIQKSRRFSYNRCADRFLHRQDHRLRHHRRYYLCLHDGAAAGLCCADQRVHRHHQHYPGVRPVHWRGAQHLHPTAGQPHPGADLLHPDFDHPAV